MMKPTKNNHYNSTSIDDILNETTPVEASKIEKRMLLAAKIDEAMKAKGWQHKDLLKAIGKTNPSLVTRWLSGTHNFTMDTLVELEHALGIHLLDMEQKVDPVIYVFQAHASIETASPVHSDQLTDIARYAAKNKLQNEGILSPVNYYTSFQC